MKALFKKIRFHFHLVVAFVKKEQKIIFLSLLLGLCFFYFLPKIHNLLKKNQLQVGLVGKYTISQLPLEIQNLISQGITKVTPDGQVYPQLAESWEIKNEGREYIFNLKSSLFWQDGEPLKAIDINYNFTDVATTVMDEHKVKYELREPFAPFLMVVSRPIFRKGLLGTGDYQVSQLKKNGEIIEKIVLKPFSKRDLPKITYHFYPTEEALRNAFKLGEVNEIREVSDLADLASWPGVKITPETRYNRFVAAFFNTRTAPFDDKSVRQALAYAIDKTWTPRALSPINPESWVFNASVKPYQFNLENAKKLLENKNSLTEIELSTIPSLLKVAEEVKSNWERLGLNTKVKVLISLDEPFQALLATHDIPLDPDQYVYWHSTQSSNISRYNSPKIDKLLEEGRRTFDKEKRKEIYLEFQKTLVEDSPAVFLFHPTLYTLSRL
jgi:peptide/nickel transport system substrate-binding protein